MDEVFVEGLGPQIWILPDFFPRSEQVWRNGWKQLYISCVQRPFWFPFKKSVSLFLAKYLLKLETNMNKSSLQPVFWNASRFSENTAGFFLESPLCLPPRTLHSNGSPCNYATWTSVRNDGEKTKIESPLSCHGGASKNFFAKLEDEGGFVLFVFLVEPWQDNNILYIYIYISYWQFATIYGMSWITRGLY